MNMCMLLSMHRKPTYLVENKKTEKELPVYFKE